MDEKQLLEKLTKTKNVTVKAGMFGTVIQFWPPDPSTANAHSFLQRGDGKWYHANGWSRQSHRTLIDVVRWVKDNRPKSTATTESPEGEQ